MLILEILLAIAGNSVNHNFEASVTQHIPNRLEAKGLTFQHAHTHAFSPLSLHRTRFRSQLLRQMCKPIFRHSPIKPAFPAFSPPPLPKTT